MKQLWEFVSHILQARSQRSETFEGITAKISIPENTRIVSFSTERKDEQLKAIEFEMEPTS